MDDSFLRDVARLRQDNTREEVRQGLSNSSGRVQQVHLEAMRQIEDEDSEAAKILAGQRHGESMTAAAVSNRTAKRSLCRSNLAIALAILAIVTAIAIAVWTGPRF